MTLSRLEPATFWLVKQYLIKIIYFVLQAKMLTCSFSMSLIYMTKLQIFCV
jgi:hypothetical protein